MKIRRRGKDKTSATKSGSTISVTGGEAGARSLNEAFQLSFSSDRFTLSDTFEDDTVDCINNSGHLFSEFKKRPPTLKEALESMEYGERSEALYKVLMEGGQEKFERLEASGLTAEDVAAILCYTFECNNHIEFKDLESPYRKLNDSLSVDRSNATLKKTRGFLFLLLSALRKLPRYAPVSNVLYRGIKTQIQTEVDQQNPKRLPYTAGNEKVWWSFNSTTEDLEATRAFVEENRGTLFTLGGEAWGYDISMFSDFPDEREILLEPERRLRVTSVTREGSAVSVCASILATPLVLEDFIKVKVAKVKARKSKVKEVPENIVVENITRERRTSFRVRSHRLRYR